MEIPAEIMEFTRPPEPEKKQAFRHNYAMQRVAQEQNALARSLGLKPTMEEEEKEPYSVKEEVAAFREHLDAYRTVHSGTDVRVTDWSTQRATEAARAAARHNVTERAKMIEAQRASRHRGEVARPTEAPPTDYAGMGKEFEREFGDLGYQFDEKNVADLSRSIQPAAEIEGAIEFYRSRGTLSGDAKVGKKLVSMLPQEAAVDVVNKKELLASVKRLEAGEANVDDPWIFARAVVQAEEHEQRGWPEKTLDLALALPGFAAEYAATGGAFSLARGGTKLLISKIMSRLAKKAAGSVPKRLAASSTARVAGHALGHSAAAAGEAASLGAGVLAHTAMMPHRIAQQTARVMLEDRDKTWFEALPKAVARQAIEMGSERLGGLFGRAVPPATRMSMLRKVGEKIGFHGALQEIGEEVAGDVVGGLTGANQDFGTFGKLFGPKKLEAMEEYAAMGAVFLIPGAVGKAGSYLDARAVGKIVADLESKGQQDLAEQFKQYITVGVDRGVARQIVQTQLMSEIQATAWQLEQQRAQPREEIEITPEMQAGVQRQRQEIGLDQPDPLPPGTALGDSILDQEWRDEEERLEKRLDIGFDVMGQPVGQTRANMLAPAAAEWGEPETDLQGMPKTAALATQAGLPRAEAELIGHRGGLERQRAEAAATMAPFPGHERLRSDVQETMLGVVQQAEAEGRDETRLRVKTTSGEVITKGVNREADQGNVVRGTGGEGGAGKHPERGGAAPGAAGAAQKAGVQPQKPKKQLGRRNAGKPVVRPGDAVKPASKKLRDILTPPAETAKPAERNWQYQEEFLRDVESVMDGTNTGEFGEVWFTPKADHAAVKDEAEKRLRENPNKRKAIDQVHKDWMAVKEKAVAGLQEAPSSQPAQEAKKQFGAKAKPSAASRPPAAEKVKALLDMHSGHPQDWTVGKIESLFGGLSRDETKALAASLGHRENITRVELKNLFLNRLASWARIQFRGEEATVKPSQAAPVAPGAAISPKSAQRAAVDAWLSNEGNRGKLRAKAAKESGKKGADLEDFVGDIQLTVLKNADSFDPAKGKVGAWIMGQVASRKIDAFRKKKRRLTASSLETDAGTKPEPTAPAPVKLPTSMAKQVRLAGGLSYDAVKAESKERAAMLRRAYPGKALFSKKSKSGLDDMAKTLGMEEDALYDKLIGKELGTTESAVMFGLEAEQLRTKQQAEPEEKSEPESSRLRPAWDESDWDENGWVAFSGVPFFPVALQRFFRRLPGMNVGRALKKFGRRMLKGRLADQIQQANRERLATIAYHAQLLTNQVKDLHTALGKQGIDYRDAKRSMVTGLNNLLSHQDSIRSGMRGTLQNQVGGPLTWAQEQQLRHDARNQWEQEVRGKLEPPVAEALFSIRNHLDDISGQLVRTGAVEGGLVWKFDANLGIYLHRSYKIHDPADRDKWLAQLRDPFDKEGQRVWNQARQQIRQHGNTIITNRLKPWAQLSDAEIDVEIEAILAGAAGKADDKGGAGADLDILKSRTDIEPWKGELYGEYKDAVANYQKAITKMARVLANHQFTEFVKGLVGTGLVFKNPKGEAVHKLSEIRGLQPTIARGFQGTELFVDQETVDGLVELFGTGKGNAVMDGAMVLARAAGTANVMATVGNVGTHLNNLFSGPGTLAANGINPMHALKAFSVLWNDDASARKEHLRLIKAGLNLGGTSMDLISDMAHDFTNSRMMQALGGHAVFTDVALGRLVKEWIKKPPKWYKSSDLLWRLAHYYGNKAMYQGRLSEEAAEKRAIFAANNTYQNYDEMAPWVRESNKLLQVYWGSFFAFSAESARNTYHTFKMGLEDLGTPGLRAVGLRRLLSASVVVSGAATLALTWAVRMHFGIDDDKDDAARLLGRFWDANGELLPLGPVKDGKYEYLNLSRWNYYNIWRKPVIAYLRDKDDKAFKARLLAAAEEFTKPRTDPGIFAKAAVEAAWGETDRGRPLVGAKARLGHVAATLLPGEIRHIWRIQDAINGDNDRDLSTEMLAFAGRAGHVDAKVALTKAFGPAFDKAMSQAEYPMRRIFTKAAKAGDDEIKQAVKETDAKRREVWNDMRLAVRAAETMGLSGAEIIASLKAGGVNEDDLASLMDGKYTPYKPDGRSVKRIMDREGAAGRPIDPVKLKEVIGKVLAEGKTGD